MYVCIYMYIYIDIHTYRYKYIHLYTYICIYLVKMYLQRMTRTPSVIFCDVIRCSIRVHNFILLKSSIKILSVSK